MFSAWLGRFHRHRRKVGWEVGKVALVAGLVCILVTHVVVVGVGWQPATQHAGEQDQGGSQPDPVLIPGRKSPQLRLQQSSLSSLVITVTSSKDNVTVVVDNTVIYESKSPVSGRGIHVLVLHQTTGAVMAQRVFDTYSPREDEALTLFLSLVSEGRLLVFAIKDEGTFQLRQPARKLLARLGSKYSSQVGWRDMWTMVTIHGSGPALGEEHNTSPDFGSWASPCVMVVEVELVPAKDCMWEESEESQRRRDFCGKREGFGSVCSCSQPATIHFTETRVLNNNIGGVPVVVIASNRPHYLYRMLRSLLSASGARRDSITVFIDGFYDEPLAVAELFGLRGIQHSPVGHRNARISQHYKASLASTFQMFPRAQYAIVVEEDLDISPDFFSYFSQTVRLLDSDPTLYCISAWNDQGYQHTSSDPTLLYRVETMPGLGWILKRSLFEQELEPQWPTPDKTWDWDMWMRLPDIRQGRECVIPEVSRTFHFGSSGLNMNSYFHDIYFNKHSFNTVRDVELSAVESVTHAQYEDRLRVEMRDAVVLNGRLGLENSVSPCEEEFYGSLQVPGLLFIQMEHSKDFTSWLALAKCLHIWDLDARGFHKGMWTLRMEGHTVFVIGAPYSPYSIHKSEDVIPLVLDTVGVKGV